MITRKFAEVIFRFATELAVLIVLQHQSVLCRDMVLPRRGAARGIPR